MRGRSPTNSTRRSRADRSAHRLSCRSRSGRRRKGRIPRSSIRTPTNCSTLCIYAMRYEWDEAKNLQNQRKHDGISFELAALVFEDERCLVYPDRIDSKTEERRWHAIGAVQIEPGTGA